MKGIKLSKMGLDHNILFKIFLMKLAYGNQLHLELNIELQEFHKMHLSNGCTQCYNISQKLGLEPLQLKPLYLQTLTSLHMRTF